MFTDAKNTYLKAAMAVVVTTIAVLLGVLIHMMWVHQNTLDAQTAWIISEPAATRVPDEDVEEYSGLETYWGFANLYDNLPEAEQRQFCADAHEQGYGEFSVKLWVDAYRFQGINHDMQAITEMLFSRCG